MIRRVGLGVIEDSIYTHDFLDVAASPPQRQQAFRLFYDRMGGMISQCLLL
ncbi:hypothetical protein GWO54_02485 [Corynebacterium macginleyi]|uniref:hypothetical protein n=1 Tax=Corynebacterium macginleyi TaxID=38290 RepID=UPI00190C693C|nr:hypothetical protein [Corynebacterium macginleyi]MBK4141464.1 hypothetical protein [Corynebacterium macginleyi]